MRQILKLFCYLMLSQFIFAEKANIEQPEINQQEANLKKIANSYLLDELKMDPQEKSVTIIKDFSEWKKNHQITDLSKSYRILAKFNDKDVWLFHYTNKNNDDSPKVGNGAGQARLILSTITSKVMGIWLMPK